LKISPKKSLGQNFLVNEGVLDRIVATAQIVPTDTIVEIGPGTGNLTSRLVATGARVIAIEKDSRLIAPLREKFSTSQNLEIIEADILRLEIKNLNLKISDFKIVANIPYYLTSHLIRLLLESWPSPSCAVLMVQEEVAKRMLEKPPHMNLLALSVQLYAKPSIVMRVSRGSFRPTPTVDSAVIKLDIPEHSESQRAVFARIMALAKTVFVQKRKQIKSRMSEIGMSEIALSQIGVSPTSRPQELSVEDWTRLERGLH